MTALGVEAEGPSERASDAPRRRLPLALRPDAWLGLANVALLAAALVAVLRQRYVGDWRGAWEQLPDPRWALVLALLGLVLFLARPDRWGVAVSLLTLAAGSGVFLAAIWQQVLYAPFGPRQREPLALLSAQTWQDWIETPMRAEGIAALAFVSVALTCSAATLILRQGDDRYERPVVRDHRWWASAGAYAVLVVTAIALLRLWDTQDTMHRELGTFGFLLLAAAGLAAFITALLVGPRVRNWLPVALLVVVTAMCWGPVLAWFEETKELLSTDLLQRSMVVEGLTGLVLGTAGVLAAVLCLVRDAQSVDSTTQHQ